MKPTAKFTKNPSPSERAKGETMFIRPPERVSRTRWTRIKAWIKLTLRGKGDRIMVGVAAFVILLFILFGLSM